MKRRPAFRLPRYVLAKRSKSGFRYFFNVPTWARRTDCPVSSEPLGSDYEAAVARAEALLLPAFDDWRTGKQASRDHSSLPALGTLDWVFAEFRADRRYTKLDPRTRRNHEFGMRLVGQYALKDGRTLGTVRLTSITTAVVDTLYERLCTVSVKLPDGTTVQRERRTTANHAMKTARRAWNVASRRNPNKLPPVNPFSAMGLCSSERETPTATYEELKIFRSWANKLGHPSLATAALMAWEWLPRVKDIFCTFDAAHYRPKDRPNAVYIEHKKTQPAWVPLFDDKGVALYPELMRELDAIKRERIAGLMIRRDWDERATWPTYPKEGEADLTYMSRKVKEIMRAAALRKELTFTSFAHGGFTESADADLTDAEIRAQGRNKSAKVLPRYAKRTMKQVATAAKKRRVTRTDGGRLSE